ncbi:hypothetical protein GCM10010464_38700 [Pseudonocardia yunnanensis]|uniref:Uncharacterized protein n=1 Tax=Pseudonocardia yunnanensis TaxID=58107 RepID=A0ABW4EXZ2_9PSEU
MTYVLLSLFWTVAGLVVGYCLGRAGRLEAPEVAMHRAENPPSWWRRHLGSRLVGVLLVVLAVLSVLTGATFIDRQADIAACQNEYNRQFAAALTERNVASAREREGQRQLLDAALRPRDDLDAAALTAAYQRYLAILAAADAQREANPLPVRAC